MKNLFGLCLLLVLSTAALGQISGTVSGRAVTLIDGKSGVSGSRITLTSLTQSDLTYAVVADTDGNFVLSNVTPGEYRVTATGGILAIAMSGELRIRVIAGENPPIQIVVGPSADAISESVTVSASQSQPIEQVSKTVDTISAQQMRERADFTLVDTLRTIPGFRVQQLGGFGRTASIKARGLRNQDTAVLIDGIRFRDPGSITGDASPFLSDITLTSVSRIEVLRGSGSSLYGTNAIGGTLDLQTPIARDGIHGQVSAAAGGLGMSRFRGNISYGDSSIPFGISGALSRTAYTSGIDGDDNADNTNFQSRIDFNPGGRTTLSGRFFVSRGKVRLNASPDTFGELPPATTIIDAIEGVTFVPDINDPDSVQRSRFFTGQFTVNHHVDQRFVIDGYYQALTAGRRNDDGLLGPGFQSQFTSIFDGAIHTANIHGKWIPASSHTFTAGYEVEVERFRNASLTPSGVDDFTTRAGQHSHTIYSHHTAGFLDDRLQFSGGVRAQWFSLDRPKFSRPDGPYSEFTLEDPPAAYIFDGSASYFIKRTGTKLRVHAGNGYRLPSLYERFGTSYFFGLFFPQGNPELRPERSIGIDAGLDHYWFNNRFKASATWFYTRIKDEITYLPTDDLGAPAYYNFDRHYSRGAEFTFDARPTRSTDVFVSYTFTNSDIRNFRRPAFINAVALPDRTSFGIPDHQVTMVVTQRIKRFWISGDVLATSSYLAPIFSSSDFSQYTYRFKGNRRVDLTAGYTFPLSEDRLNLRVFATIENLFANEYFENGFRTVPRNGRIGLSLGF